MNGNLKYYLLLPIAGTAKVKHRVFIGEGMPHIWPLLPVMKEAGVALDKMIKLLKQDDDKNS